MSESPYSHIFSVMYRINRSSSEDILSQNKVYLNTVLLEEALELYTEIYENLYRVSIGKALLALDTIVKRYKPQTPAIVAPKHSIYYSI